VKMTFHLWTVYTGKNMCSCQFTPPYGIMACTRTHLLSGIRKVRYLLCLTEQNIRSTKRSGISVAFSFSTDTSNNLNLINVVTPQLILWKGINRNQKYNNANTVPMPAIRCDSQQIPPNHLTASYEVAATAVRYSLLNVVQTSPRTV
jgi:hypothetical protein